MDGGRPPHQTVEEDVQKKKKKEEMKGKSWHTHTQKDSTLWTATVGEPGEMQRGLPLLEEEGAGAGKEDEGVRLQVAAWISRKGGAQQRGGFGEIVLEERCRTSKGKKNGAVPNGVQGKPMDTATVEDLKNAQRPQS